MSISRFCLPALSLLLLCGNTLHAAPTFSEEERIMVINAPNTSFVYVPSWAAKALLNCDTLLLSCEWKTVSRTLYELLESGARIAPKSLVEPVVLKAASDLSSLSRLLPQRNQFKEPSITLHQYLQAIQSGSATIVRLSGPGGTSITCQLQ